MTEKCLLITIKFWSCLELEVIQQEQLRRCIWSQKACRRWKCAKGSGQGRKSGKKILTKTSTKKEAEYILEEQMPENDAGEFNQSLMELGATVCLPNGMPKCEKCPILNCCKSKKHGTIEQYPKKSGKVKRRIEKKNMILLNSEARIFCS